MSTVADDAQDPVDDKTRIARAREGYGAIKAQYERFEKHFTFIGFVLLAAVLGGGYLFWLFFSSETSLPKVHRETIQGTICKFLSTEQCDGLIVAIEHTKDFRAISSANAGDLKPAQQIAAAQAAQVAADPSASLEDKVRARSDAATLATTLASIEGYARRSAESLQRIEAMVPTLKKETSADPTKELANRGKTRRDFDETITNCDLADAQLFRKAGVTIAREDALYFLSFAKDTQCLELYRDRFRSFGQNVCTGNEFFAGQHADHLRFLAPAVGRGVFFKRLASDPQRLAFAESLCGKDRLKSAYPDVYAANPPQSLDVYFPWVR